MAKPILDDELWSLIQPLLPPPKPRRTRYPGRKPLDDRAVLTGILFVLQSGIPWEMLPQEMGCGSGMSCWRRLRDWQQAGVWDRLVACGHRFVLHSCSGIGSKQDPIPPIGRDPVQSTISLPKRRASRSR
ncbi:Insertion element IS402 [Burkholderia lata]|nr:Insertion element IS402 [Burkholderia lata]